MMIEIEQCTIEDFEEIDNLFKKLINEIIMKTTGDPSLFRITDTFDLFKQGLSQGIYSVFKAINNEKLTIGFILYVKVSPYMQMEDLESFKNYMYWKNIVLRT